LQKNKQAAVDAACFRGHLKKPTPQWIFLSSTWDQPRNKDKTLCGN
jgi:hypothetical protein